MFDLSQSTDHAHRLHSVGLMTTGDYSEDLHELAGSDTGWFLLISVIVPSILGILCRQLLGKERVAASKANLKIGEFGHPTLSQLLERIGVFAAGDCNSRPGLLGCDAGDHIPVMRGSVFRRMVIAHLRNSDRSDQIALMFGLGMNNNGTGLVLASMALADHPQVLLPIIFYNLVQHLVAGTVDHLMFYRHAEAPLPEKGQVEQEIMSDLEPSGQNNGMSGRADGLDPQAPNRRFRTAWHRSGSDLHR